MSRIRADRVVNKNATGGPDFPLGANITGIVTATSFSGSGANLTNTPATSLTGTPNITVGTVGAGNVTSTGTVSAVTGNFTGNVSIGGTLTYDDVTNIDSVGLITARNGINVLAGISTFKGANFNGTNIIKEKCNINAGKLSDNLNIDLENGMVHGFGNLGTTAETATSTPNIRVSASVSLDSVLDVGDTIVVTVMTTAAAAAFSANWTIDTAAVTEKWVGGAAPAAGGAAGIDTYTLTITKTGSAAFNVIGNVTNAA